MIDIGLDLKEVPTPCYVCDLPKLKKNLEILKKVREEAGCKILLALKAFAMFSVFPIVREYLDGTCASSLFEARLGREEFGKEVHTYAPAYKDDEFPEIIKYSDHIVFNNFSQYGYFEKKIKEAGKSISCGIRVNPEVSEVKVEIYNPCCRFSRLGTTIKEFEGNFDGFDGIHFHALCEKKVDSLERTLQKVESLFAPYLRKAKWVNFGGGHHITADGYGVDKLVRLIKDFKKKYDVEVYLEPGEAIALNAGYLVASVLDVMRNEMDIAILDTSASAHMPDVIEMPYRPEIIGAGKPNEYSYTYRLGGMTCLAGDVIGDYSFKNPLKRGDKLVFTDMLHYTMVKNNMFNGINLPSIAVWSPETGLKLVKKFGYEDFKSRLS